MSSFTPYAFNRHFAEYLVDKRYYLPNMAVSHFPWEIAAVPKSWVSRTGKLKWYKGAQSRLVALWTSVLTEVDQWRKKEAILHRSKSPRSLWRTFAKLWPCSLNIRKRACSIASESS